MQDYLVAGSNYLIDGRQEGFEQLNPRGPGPAGLTRIPQLQEVRPMRDALIDLLRTCPSIDEPASPGEEKPPLRLDPYPSELLVQTAPVVLDPLGSHGGPAGVLASPAVFQTPVDLVHELEAALELEEDGRGRLTIAKT